MQLRTESHKQNVVMQMIGMRKVGLIHTQTSRNSTFSQPPLTIMQNQFHPKN